jgi:hypothetical protein
MKRRLTDRDFELIVEMRSSGASYERIGRRIGCSAKAVSWHCLRLAVEPPKPAKLWNGIKGPATLKRNGHVVRRFTPEEDALIVALDLQGFPISVIARRCGRRWNSIKGRFMTLARREEREERNR